MSLFRSSPTQAVGEWSVVISPGGRRIAVSVSGCPLLLYSISVGQAKPDFQRMQGIWFVKNQEELCLMSLIQIMSFNGILLLTKNVGYSSGFITATF